MPPAVVLTLSLLSIITILLAACTAGVWRLVGLVGGFTAEVGQAGKAVVHARDEMMARIRERV